MTKKTIRVGIVGVSGYGGGELLRYLAHHPVLKLTCAYADTSAGKTLRALSPALSLAMAEQEIRKWDAVHAAEHADLLFLSLPTGASKAIAAQIPPEVRVIDLGGDHRFTDGWTYGLAEIFPEHLEGATRVANPGCYPTAIMLALAPLLKAGANPMGMVITAVSGLSGRGRADADTSGFGEMNEDSCAYGFFKHPHIPEIQNSLNAVVAHKLGSFTFVPQYVPMTRGLSVIGVLKGRGTTEECIVRARESYVGHPFVRVIDKPPHTKHAAGTNFAFVSYVAGNDGTVVALCTIDNLGKGAAGQAIQNANLMFGLPETAGLKMVPVWP